MSKWSTIAFGSLSLAVIGFAALNPQLEVHFSAGFVEYRGNTLGLALVLLTLTAAGFASRAVVKKLAGTRHRRS